MYKKKILFQRDNISQTFRIYRKVNYSALQQSVAVESQPAHLVESQHSVQSAHLVESQHSVCSQHGSAASASFGVLLQAQEAAANIAATIAIDINTFFMVNHFKGLNKTLNRKNMQVSEYMQIFKQQNTIYPFQTAPSSVFYRFPA